MKKIILWSGVALLVLALAAGAVWWELRPQVITLKNGTKLTLVQVTYGQHHHFRGIKSGSRLRGSMTFDTTNDTLMVWIKAEHKPNQWPNYQLLIYDPAQTACVGAWQRTSSNIKNDVDVQGFVLDGFPRRSGKMILRVTAWNQNGNGQQVPKGQFVIANPGPRSFPEWQPDPLPNTQSDGDLEVTLTHFDTASSGFFFGGDSGPSNDPRQRGVQIALHAVQNGNVATNWEPVRIETSDATGNGVLNMSTSTSRNDDGDPTMTYQWGLWPDEKAWKLRVEMSRTAGFSSDETWSLANVPVQAGQWQDLWNFGPRNNSHKLATFAETTLGGHHLTISPVLLMTGMNFGNGQKQAGFRVTADSSLPDSFRMTLLSATDEHGRKVMQPGWGPNGGNGSFVFQLPDIGNAKSVNLTVALHQSRFVEFLVKPGK